MSDQEFNEMYTEQQPGFFDVLGQQTGMIGGPYSQGFESNPYSQSGVQEFSYSSMGNSLNPYTQQGQSMPNPYLGIL